jgi:hypothetical protein
VQIILKFSKGFYTVIRRGLVTKEHLTANNVFLLQIHHHALKTIMYFGVFVLCVKYVPARQHGHAFQKTVNFIFTVVHASRQFSFYGLNICEIFEIFWGGDWPAD